MRKGEETPLRDHIHAFKNICDSLAAIGKPVNDKEKVFYLLTSLGSTYEHFATTMLKPPLPLYKDVVSQLQNLDQRRIWISSTGNTVLILSILTWHSLPNKVEQEETQVSPSLLREEDLRPAARGNQPTQNKSGGQRRPPPPGERWMTQNERDLYRTERCQYCGTQGHIAKICWWIPKKSEPTNLALPQAFAALTLDTSVIETEWMTDTGASNHMTGKAHLLKNFKPYKGSDSVLIGDGSSLTICGIGDTKVQQPNASLPFHDVLYVPALTKKLISVSQLTSHLPVTCEFSND